MHSRRDRKRSHPGFPALIALSAVLAAYAGAGTKVVPGDEAFTSMEYQTALSLYGTALQADSGRGEILWRMARLYVCLGDIAPDAESGPLYRRAEEFARRTIKADSTIGEGHTWLAAALGSMAMEEGAKRKVQLVREIQLELTTAIRLNPNDDVAHSILGSFYRALGNISWIERSLANVFLGGIPSGGFEEAEKELLTAIKLAPGEFRHYYELGRLYADWERPADALKAFRRSTEVGPRMVADRRRLEQAKIRIAELTAG